MKRPGTFGSGVMAMALVAFALSLTLRCTAEPADDADFAALQVDARKSFKEVVTPFVDDLLHALSRARSDRRAESTSDRRSRTPAKLRPANGGSRRLPS